MPKRSRALARLAARHDESNAYLRRQLLAWGWVGGVALAAAGYLVADTVRALETSNGGAIGFAGLVVVGYAWYRWQRLCDTAREAVQHAGELGYAEGARDRDAAWNRALQASGMNYAEWATIREQAKPPGAFD